MQSKIINHPQSLPLLSEMGEKSLKSPITNTRGWNLGVKLIYTTIILWGRAKISAILIKIHGPLATHIISIFF